MILQQAHKSFWKDPLCIKCYSYEVLLIGMLTDNDIQDFIMSRQEAKRCGDPWCAPLFLSLLHELELGFCEPQWEVQLHSREKRLSGLRVWK